MDSAARRFALGRGALQRSSAWLLAVAALAVVLFAGSAQAADPCAEPVHNPVACENTKPGTPEASWRVSGTGDPTIQGFSTSISVDRGGTIAFKIKTPAASYRIDILRLGYYGGDGARLVQGNVRPSAVLPQAQPACLTQASTGVIDCGNWAVSASWSVPTTAISGVYVARLVRDDTLGASLIPFVVRDDAGRSDIVLQTNDTSWVAYNDYGGNSLYKCTIAACPAGNPGGYKAAYKSSYNKPFTTAGLEGPVFWHNEYSMVRFLEANGYDVSYVSGFDVHKRGGLLQNHKLFISSGHDEYWSATQRANVVAARDAGVNLAFFSGNEMFWKTRWEPSIDAGATADRTIVAYKDTHFEAPMDPVEWTGTWRDRRFLAGDDPQQPENALTGQFFVVNQGTTEITVPAAYGKLRLWRNTGAAQLLPGQTLTLAPSSLGYEWDEDVDNGFRPRGLFHMSSTTASVPQVFDDYGTDVNAGTATHHLTMYRAASGARVFGAGTVLWSWGLDSWASGNPPDRNMQQATVNLLADMGAQPFALLPGLVAAGASTDASAPTSTINSPAPASTVADGARITVSGTASDVGGVVAGVEISTDGGRTWHPATGTTSWSYTWLAHGNPTTTLKTRAVDDSGNVETPAAGISLNVTCPCSLWGSNVIPSTVDSGDGSPIEVGVKFRSETAGEILGIRFYKASTNTGTHVGSLWTAGGQRLAQATFSSESASGWQTVSFANPVTITPDTTYVASYFAPNGHYAASRGWMYPDPAPPRGGGGVDSPPLHALRNFGSAGNGVFTYASSSTFPSSSFKAANYWVDVVFAPGSGSPPSQPTNVTATPGQTSATVSWTAPVQGPVTSYKITPYIGTTAQTATVTTGTPPATTTTVGGLTAGTAYTFT
ncbi:MAG: DUF4082 domain-containing protein, partial [Chloroflexota bacterium]|nr:DUF4082 domain-containing protein [Chloroflexota bacterium]